MKVTTLLQGGLTHSIGLADVAVVLEATHLQGGLTPDTLTVCDVPF